MIKIIVDEWLRLSIRFIENEWLKLLLMNELSIRFIEDEWLKLFVYWNKFLTVNDNLMIQIFHEIYCWWMIQIICANTIDEW